MDIIEITDEQIKSIHKAFLSYDVKGEGHIPAQKLSDVMKNLGHRLRRDELRDLIATVDTDGSGTIEWNEFLPLMAAKVKEKEEHVFYKNLFRILDKKHKGFIRCDDLKYILDALAKEVNLTEDEVEDMISAVDEDGNGEVSFDEFYKLMTTE